MSEDVPPQLAEEAVRLLGAAQDWVRQSFPAGGPTGHGGPECQWCPLCQLMSVLRGERPEVTARVAEAGTAVAGALKALLDATATARPSAPGGDDGGASEPPPRVQHIDLGLNDT